MTAATSTMECFVITVNGFQLYSRDSNTGVFL